jgi:hypothetical protein
MKANPDEFQAIAIGKKNKNENISFNLNGNIIKCEDEVKLLSCSGRWYTSSILVSERIFTLFNCN